MGPGAAVSNRGAGRHAKRVPQFAQNFAPGGPTVLHEGHGLGCGGASDVPHSAQNFPGGTLAPQPGHAIMPPAAAGADAPGAAPGGG